MEYNMLETALLAFTTPLGAEAHTILDGLASSYIHLVLYVFSALMLLVLGDKKGIRLQDGTATTIPRSLLLGVGTSLTWSTAESGLIKQELSVIACVCVYFFLLCLLAINITDY